MKKNYKIALFMIHPLNHGGGVEKYFIDLAKSLYKNTMQLNIITMDDNFYHIFLRLTQIYYTGDFFGKVIDIRRVSKETIIKNLCNSKWIRASRKNLGNILNDYDVIYTRNELADLFLLKSIGYSKLPPIIVGVHTPIFYPITKSFYSKFHNFLYMGPIYKWLIGGVKLVHVSNKFSKHLFDSKFKVKTKLVYHPFSVEDTLNHIKLDISELSFDKNRCNIAFVSRLSEQKGIDILLKIIDKLSLVPNVADKIKINIFGSGEKKYEVILGELEKKYNFVRYYGHVENKFIPSILNNHFMLLSTSRWEVLPFNILEAQAVGLPVIAFDIPGPNDIVVNNKTGFLANSEEEFVKKILFLIENRQYFKAKDIKMNIFNKFDQKKIYNQLFLMFNETYN